MKLLNYTEYIKEYSDYEDEDDSLGGLESDYSEEDREILFGGGTTRFDPFKLGFAPKFSGINDKTKILREIGTAFIKKSDSENTKFENDDSGEYKTLLSAYEETKKGNNKLAGMCGPVSEQFKMYIDEFYPSVADDILVKRMTKFVEGAKHNSLEHAVVSYGLYIIDLTYAQYNPKAGRVIVYDNDDYVDQFWSSEK